jgi:hypothetical protein
MTDADEIRAAFVVHLRSISSLVSLLGGDAANIQEYVDEVEGDSFGRIANLRPPKLLVMSDGTETQGSPRALWAHKFLVVIRTIVSHNKIMRQLVDGIPSTGNGQPMFYTEVVPGVHSMQEPVLGRRVTPVSETSSFDYWAISTAFLEK